MKMQILAVVLSLIILTGYSCAPSKQFSKKQVAENISTRTGYTLSDTSVAGHFSLPLGTDTRDGINEDEAVAIALWNNPQFQADLADINIANADVIDAGLIQNPVLRYLSPAMGVAASGYINLGLDFLWQRPKRIAAAAADAERRKEVAIQRGLTLVRDVQVAYADQAFAQRKSTIYRQNLQIRAETMRLINARLRTGEISELEANTFLVDSLQANDVLLAGLRDTSIFTNRLNTLLGYRADTAIGYATDSMGTKQLIDRQAILNTAFENHPEIIAAKKTMEASAARIGWERSRIFALLATLNFQHIPSRGGSDWLPNTFNPGIQGEIPLFNRNQGRIQRAQAEMEQAAFQYVAVRQRIAQQLVESYYLYQQAYQSLAIWNSQVMPTLERSVRQVRKAYELGETSYLNVLEAMRQWQTANLRQAEIEFDIRRSISNLNWSIGKQYLPY